MRETQKQAVRCSALIARRYVELAKVAGMKDMAGKPRHPKDKARIRQAIERDIAYLQRELQQWEGVA